MKSARWLILLVLALLLVLFFASGLPQQLRLETLQAHQGELLAFRHAHPLSAAALLLLVYLAAALLPLPGAIFLAVVAGALFGFVKGLLLTAVGAPLCATAAFLAARYLLRAPLQQRFGALLAVVDENTRRDGALYLFTLRLLPVLPFSLVNLVFGLSDMRARTFYAASLLGMLPGLVVLVLAGRELAALESIGDALSPGMIGAFALLGLFPWVARRLVVLLRARRLPLGDS